MVNIELILNPTYLRCTVSQKVIAWDNDFDFPIVDYLFLDGNLTGIWYYLNKKDAELCLYYLDQHLSDY